MGVLRACLAAALWIDSVGASVATREHGGRLRPGAQAGGPAQAASGVPSVETECATNPCENGGRCVLRDTNAGFRVTVCPRRIKTLVQKATAA